MQTALRFLLMLLLFVIHARAQFVELDADIEVTGWGQFFDPPMFEPHVWRVSCTVGTNSWRIAADDRDMTETWRYTGSNIVTTQSFRHPGEKPPTVIRRIYTNAFNGEIETPEGTMVSTAIRAAWLAFCSGPYLSNTNAQVALLSPMWKERWLHSDFAAEPRGFPMQVTRFNDDLGLPISVEIFSKSGHPLLQYRTLHGRGPNPDSRTVMGWMFPTEFRAIEYQPKRGAKDKWEAELTVKGRVTSVGPVSKMKEDPAPASRAVTATSP